MAHARQEDVPADFITVGFDAVGYCLEAWLGPRGQGLTRPVSPEVRQAIAEEAARSVKQALGGLGHEERLAAAGAVIEGALYMVMALFEEMRTDYGDASLRFLRGKLLN